MEDVNDVWDDFREAITFWTWEPLDVGIETFMKNWVGRPAVIRRAAECRGKLSARRLSLLNDACQGLEDKFLTDKRRFPELDDEFWEQTVKLARGICHGVRAASVISSIWSSRSTRPLPEKCDLDLQYCFESYDEGWRLDSQQVDSIVGKPTRKAAGRKRGRGSFNVVLGRYTSKLNEVTVPTSIESILCLGRSVLTKQVRFTMP